jgi:hypothetical protein
LSLDADALNGWIEAELLTASGEAVKGAPPIRIEGKEGTRFPLGFAGVQEMPKQCRIRFKMQNARVFAFGLN